ncbi:MAG: hypothetical protein ACE5HY_01345 [Candidatus Hydrothermarchaeales archaeon]
MGDEKTADEKKIFMCRHYYEGKEYMKGKEADEVVHKHTVTVIQKEEEGELKWICNHNTECTGRYFAVERRRVDCPYKPDQS